MHRLKWRLQQIRYWLVWVTGFRPRLVWESSWQRWFRKCKERERRENLKPGGYIVPPDVAARIIRAMRDRGDRVE